MHRLVPLIVVALGGLSGIASAGATSEGGNLTGVPAAGAIMLARLAPAVAQCPRPLLRWSEAPYRSACYAGKVPARVLRAAPFPVADPRQPARAVVHLPLIGIFVQRYGADEVYQGIPIGPPIVFEYVFGTPPHSGPNNTWQTGRPPPSFLEIDETAFPGSSGGVSRDGGMWDDEVNLSRYRMQVRVILDGTAQQAATIGNDVARAIRSIRPRPATRLRVYVSGPRPPLQVGDPVTFWILENIRLAVRAADFDFTLGGRWARPQLVTPDGSQSCGGDNPIQQPRRSGSAWTLTMGDCEEVGLVLTPLARGSYRLQVNTYDVPIDRRGRLDAAHRRLVPGGGYRWSGSAR